MQLSFTAPGPVQNLNFAFLPDDPDPSTTYNITSRAYNIPVRISWQEPEYLNGEFITYSYRLMETAGDVVIEDTNTTNLTVVESISVSPFTNYTATVAAYTGAGRGETSTEVTISPEAGNKANLTLEYYQSS